MFLAGLTSAICVAPARWYIYGLAAATGPSQFQPSPSPLSLTITLTITKG